MYVFFWCNSKALTSYVSVSVSSFANGLTDAQKNCTLQFILQSLPANLALIASGPLRTLACEHKIQNLRTKALLLQSLQAHACSWACLVHLADAQEAGLLAGPSRSSGFVAKRFLLASHHRSRHTEATPTGGLLANNLPPSIFDWPQIQTEDSLKAVYCYLLYI
jgi:hypothetical protein